MGAHSPTMEPTISHSSSGSPAPGHSPSPAQAHASHAMSEQLSPSHTLPSFLDTYTTRQIFEAATAGASSPSESQQPATLEPRVTFKQEEPGPSRVSVSASVFAQHQPSSSSHITSFATSLSAGFPSTSSFVQHDLSGSVSVGHGPQQHHPQQSQQFFLKKESYSPRSSTPTSYSLPDYYQPPTSTPFPQFVGSDYGGGVHHDLLHDGGGGSTLPPALQGALQGALHGSGHLSLAGSTRGGHRRTTPSTITSGWVRHLH